MNAVTWSPAAGRFAWKEYRTLRTMWLAVAGLGVVMQLACRALATPGSDVSAMLFGLALGTTIMFAVGAAAVMFSAEHEDETYQFLSGLPLRWLPMTLGKLAVATTSSVALAVVLMLAGWAIGGGRWPFPEVARDLIMLLGVGIFEAWAWATLFSLLVKRPLVAAVLTISIGTTAVQYLVSTKAAGGLGAGNPRAYADAATLRLTVVFILLIVSALLARRWLTIGYRPHRIIDIVSASRLGELRSRILSRIGRWGTSVSRRHLSTRLVWQSWRQSWNLLLVPAFVAFFLTVGISAAASAAFRISDPLVAACAYFLPALYGAMVFGADQRRRQYRFLADHGTPPANVWLARNVLWGGALIAITVVLVAIAFGISFSVFTHQVRQFVDRMSLGYSGVGDRGELLVSPLDHFATGAGIAVCGALLAFAIGQSCSMLFRSEIMAAFAACVASILVTAWCALVYAWELNSALFVLPLAVAFLLATWLRAPDWLIERNCWRAWRRPASVIALTALGTSVAVPIVRLAQIPASALQDARRTVETVREEFDAGNTPAARATAAMYERAVEIADSWREHDPLDRWANNVDYTDSRNNIDFYKIPADEMEDYRIALKKQQELEEQSRVAALDQFIAASRRPSCRFDFDLRYAPLRHSYPTAEELDRFRARLDPRYLRLIRLTTTLANSGVPDDRAVDWYLAGLQATAHLRDGQPTLVFIDQLSMEAGLLERIVEWATFSHPTNEEIRDAITKLQYYFADLPDPAEAIWADHNLAADVLANKQPPLMFVYPPISWQLYLSYLFHQLPWEHERAQRQLEIATAADIQRLQGLVCFLHDGPKPTPETSTDWPYHCDTLRKSLDAEADGRNEALRRSSMSKRLSFVDAEYNARVHARSLELYLVESELRYRATLLQLALELFRRDHDRYPETIAELVPEYLNEVPLDPYSGKPFFYLPHGTELPVVDALPSGEEILPGTPFFWSVGPQNLTRLVRFTEWVDVRDPDEQLATTAMYEQGRATYRFWRDDWSWCWGARSGVFPLPK